MISTGKLTEVSPGRIIPQPTNEKILFGPDSVSPYSHVFTVAKGELVVIVGYNLSATDSLFVEHVGGEGSGQFFAPVVVGGTPIKVDAVDSYICISTPGRYRLSYEGETPLGAFYVEATR